jgi:hypothetical protein
MRFDWPATKRIVQHHIAIFLLLWWGGELPVWLPEGAFERYRRKPLFDGRRERRLLSDPGRRRRIAFIKVSRSVFHFNTICFVLFSPIAFRECEL